MTSEIIHYQREAGATGTSQVKSIEAVRLNATPEAKGKLA